MSLLKRPERLFRYFPPEASDFFSAKKLWFSSLKELNDPFDVCPRFDTMLENQKRYGLQREQLLVDSKLRPAFMEDMSQTTSDFFGWFAAEPVVEKFKELVNNDFRLVCFSEKLDDLLMWGHYAKGHTGFVIEFDPEQQIFSTGDLGQVDYPQSNDRPDVEDQNQGKATPREILFRKSQHWSYEKELRLVRLTKSLPPPIERRDKKIKYFLELPANSILAVYFGWQLSPSNRAELVESLKLPEWKDVKKFVMCPEAAKYSVQPMPFDDWLNRSKKYEDEKRALDKEIQTRTQLCA